MQFVSNNKEMQLCGELSPMKDEALNDDIVIVFFFFYWNLLQIPLVGVSCACRTLVTKMPELQKCSSNLIKMKSHLIVIYVRIHLKRCVIKLSDVWLEAAQIWLLAV